MITYAPKSVPEKSANPFDAPPSYDYDYNPHDPLATAQQPGPSSPTRDAPLPPRPDLNVRIQERFESTSRNSAASASSSRCASSSSSRSERSPPASPSRRTLTKPEPTRSAPHKLQKAEERSDRAKTKTNTKSKKDKKSERNDEKKGEKKERSTGAKIAKTFGTGLMAIVVPPVVVGGAAIVAAGAVLYGTGKLLEGVGKGLSIGPEALYGVYQRRKARRNARAEDNDDSDSDSEE